MKPCSHCGSVNHQSIDCAHQSRVWTPTPEFLAEQKALEAAKQGSDPPLKPNSLAVSRPATGFSAPNRVKLAETGVLEPVFEPKPRWKGAPKVCTATNLLAHDSEKTLKKFLATCGGSMSVEKQWVCEACGKVHVECYAANSSSGKRLSQYPEGWALRIPEKVQREMSERAKRGARIATDLPNQVNAAKDVALPKGKKKPVEKGLF